MVDLICVLGSSPNYRRSDFEEGKEMISSTDLAWVAGLFDGEGCASLVRRPQKIYPVIYADISINMTDKTTIDRVQNIFGGIGGRHIQHPNNHNGRRKPMYCWSACTKDALDVLKQIYPYLVTKKEQAKYLIEYYGRKHTPTDHRTMIPEDEIAEREFFYNLLRAMHK